MRWVITIADLISIGCPQKHLITIIFGGKYFSIDRRCPYDSHLPRMRYYLLYFHIWMLFHGIWVEQGTQIINEVMILCWHLDGGHDDEIRDILPCVFMVVVDAICPA